MQEIHDEADKALKELQMDGWTNDASGTIEESLTRIKEIAAHELERMRVEDEIDESLNPNGAAS